MPYRKTPHYSDEATHTVEEIGARKRMKLRQGQRVFETLWCCANPQPDSENTCFGIVRITHCAPAQSKRQPAFMRAVKAQGMVCPQCQGPLTFMGFLPQAEYLETWQPVASNN